MASHLQSVPVVAIDGPAGAGKTTVGVWLARRIGVRFLETGYFFRALASMASDSPGPEALAYVDVDARMPPDDDWRPALRVKGRVVHDLRSPALEDRLAAIVKRGELRNAIAERVTALAGDGGCVAVGRRTCVETFPQATVRILMVADAGVRSRRRAEADGGDVSPGRNLARLRAREVAVEDPGAYTMKLDTTDMSVADVREAVLRHVVDAAET